VIDDVDSKGSRLSAIRKENNDFMNAVDFRSAVGKTLTSRSKRVLRGYRS
jgi:hypothetical protein